MRWTNFINQSLIVSTIHSKHVRLIQKTSIIFNTLLGKKRGLIGKKNSTKKRPLRPNNYKPSSQDTPWKIFSEFGLKILCNLLQDPRMYNMEVFYANLNGPIRKWGPRVWVSSLFYKYPKKTCVWLSTLVNHTLKELSNSPLTLLVICLHFGIKD